MKNFLQHIAFVFVLAAVLFPACKEKDPEPAVVRCQLTVIVTDESARPVQNALVQAGIIQKTTDAEGKCTFSDLKIETIILKVSAEDYLPVSHPVSLTQASQTEKVALTKEPPYLSVDVGQIDTREMKSKAEDLHKNTTMLYFFYKHGRVCKDFLVQTALRF